MTTTVECASAVIISGCPECDDAPYLWYHDNAWRIDTDDGLAGPTIKFCPVCGVELPTLPRTCPGAARKG